MENSTLAESVFQSNTRLVFLSGDHIINTTLSGQFFLFRDKENITFEGRGQLVHGAYGPLESPTRVVCESPVGMAFVNISSLVISRLTIVGCGVNLTESLISLAFVDQTYAAHSTTTAQKAALFLVNILDLRIDIVSIQNSSGYGLLGVNVLGDSLITNSGFLGNNRYTTIDEYCQYLPDNQDDIITCNGGNAHFFFEDLLECPSQKPSYTLNITNSIFAVGNSPYGGQLPESIVSRGTGIGVTLSQSSYGVTVVLNALTVFGNGALVGANMYLAVYESVDNSTIFVNDTQCGGGNNVLLRTKNRLGLSDGFSAGLHFSYGVFSPHPVCSVERKHQKDVLLVTGSHFYDNNAFAGAGMYVYMTLNKNYHDESGTQRFVAKLQITDTNFTTNRGMAGTGLFLVQLSTVSVQTTVETVLKNIKFMNNGFVLPLTNLSVVASDYEFSVMKAIGVENVTLSECEFIGSDGSAITLFESNLLVSGGVALEGNTGTNGGGMNLINSYLYIAPNSRIWFTGNTALRHGGAINVITKHELITALLCFYQVQDASFQPDPNITLIFRDNYAVEAGSVLYGGSIDECIVGPNSVYFGESSAAVFNKITDIGVHRNESSLIASDPTDVCPCENDTPICGDIVRSVQPYPGETFTFSVATIGQRNGTVPAIVYASFSSSCNLSLDASQQIQEVDRGCTNLTFTAQSDIDYVAPTIQIRTGSQTPGSDFVIALNIRRCPLGFVLRNGVCSCDPIPHIGDYNLTCDLQKQAILRAPGSWINASYSQGIYNGLIVHGNCPYDYCLSIATDVNLTEPDTQCAYNRTGILCGSCQPGLSLTLATSRCLRCSNSTIALVLAYALAGVLLVAILFALNLTVSMGTLGGVILYANIVYVNLITFFPGSSLNVLVVYISWINLYPGTPFCFFNGMDSYSKTWLEFSFPFYIWFIIAVIVLVSRFSFTVAKLCGPRVVPVLATLFLLSYTKLLQAVILSLSSTAILSPSGGFHVVWSPDGNVDYFRGKHIPLAIMAILILLLFHLPYTLLLVLAPLPKVQALTKYRLLAWINKLKPFLDAHYSPYKDHYRNWTGVLLLVRIILAVLVSLNPMNDPAISLLIHAIMMFLLISAAWVGGGVYKKWPHNILECSLFVNAGVLSVTTLFISSSGGRQGVAFYLSASLTLVVFIAVIIYHVGTQLNKVKWFRENFVKMQTQMFQRKRKTDSDTEQDDKASTPAVTYTSVQLREPLLEDCHLLVEN